MSHWNFSGSGALNMPHLFSLSIKTKPVLKEEMDDFFFLCIKIVDTLMMSQMDYE